MKCYLTTSLVLILLLIQAGCSWPPIPSSPLDNSEQQRAERARDAFAGRSELAHFFDEAVAYAVFPDAVRAGTGFGGGYGGGWLFRDGKVIGRTAMLQFSAGANVGLQWYRQILFFRTEKALAAFLRGSSEFVGQANLSAGTWGAHATPSYSSDVALFTELNAGLLLEGSVGAHRYEYQPIRLGADASQ